LLLGLTRAARFSSVGRRLQQWLGCALWLTGCAALISCAPHVAHANPSTGTAKAPVHSPASAAPPIAAQDETVWPPASEAPGPSPEEAADIEAEIQADHASAAVSTPDMDPAWDHVDLGEDPSALTIAPELNNSLPGELGAEQTPLACFVAEPVLEASMPAEATAEPCGIVPMVPLGVQTSIHNNATLEPFRAALLRAQRGEGQARIMFYGASHVASDLFTGVVRDKLARIAGSAGPGFFLPAKPWKYYRNANVTVERSRGLRTRRIMAKTPLPDAYGLAGVAFDSFTDRPASAAFTLNAPAPEPLAMELFFLQRPAGGTLDVLVDGKKLARVSTSAPKRGAGYSTVALPAGAQRVELRTLGDGAIRLFGTALEKQGPGVILDTLGIPGSRAKYQLLWEDELYREHLAHRRPDLVVLAYGTNESGDESPMAEYEAELRQVIERIRDVTPNAACLLVGPSDRPVRIKTDALTAHGEKYAHRPRTAHIIDAQRRVAEQLGCGFFDVVEFMGGPLSMVRWVRSAPALGTPDHVHFTRIGYERMGEVLFQALLEGATVGQLAHKR
jgi:lysophospholipase L1-like esterase